MYLEHFETANIYGLTSFLLCYKNNKKLIFLDKPTAIKVILRTMKSTGTKILKEISKETSKNIPKPLNTSSVLSTNIPEKRQENVNNPIPNEKQDQDSNTPNSKLPYQESNPAYNIIINGPVLDPIQDVNLRAVTIKDPLNIVSDNEKKLKDHLKEHEKTHAIVQDNQTLKLIGVLTSSKKVDEEKQFTPVKISHKNFKDEDKDQNFSPFSRTRYIEDKHLSEHEAASEFLKRQAVSEAMQAAIVNFNLNERPSIQLIHKDDMVNEDGSARETFDSTLNKTPKMTSNPKVKSKKEDTLKTKVKVKKDSTTENEVD